MGDREISVADMETRLKQLPEEIYDAEQKSINAKKDYLKAKAALKQKEALTILNAKCENSDLTQTDLEATAINETKEETQKEIEAEAFWRGAQALVHKLKNEFYSYEGLGNLKKRYY